jgi:transcriptional regulator with XRE-family HTH domain
MYNDIILCNNLATNLKNARKKKGYTQGELAEKVGITQQAIAKYERGLVTNMPVERLQAIADVLGVNPVDLMGWEEKQQTEEEIAKIALFGTDSEVTSEMWEEVKKYAEYIKERSKKR